MKRISRWMSIWVSYVLLIWLGSAGAILSFGSALAVPAEYQTVVYGCAAVAAVMAAVYGIPRTAVRRVLVTASAGIIACWLYMMRRELVHGAAYVGSLVSIEYSKELAGVEYLIPLEQLPPYRIRQAITVFFLAAGALLSWALAWVAARKRRGCLGVLLTLPILAAALIITREPNWAGVLFLFPFWSALIITGRRQGKEETDRAKMVLMILPVSAALTAILFFTVGQHSYSRPPKLEQLRSRILSELIVGDEDKIGFLAEGVSSDSEDIDLQGRGNLRFTGGTVMRVFMAQPGHLYLHGRSGALYTGSSWSSFEQEAYEGVDFSIYPMNIAPENAGRYPSDALIIEPGPSAGSLAYTPYNLDVGSETMPALTPVRDLYYKTGDPPPYSFAYLDLQGETPGDLNGELANGFESYHQFVMQRYRQVPDDLRPRLEELAGEEILGDGEYTEDEAVQRVTAFLAESCRYTLTPGATPDGADFVEYFLFQSRQGYCVHFASAAALLLRTLGIPARYAEGYAVPGQDFAADGWADVRDLRGHAWVEVYYRGLGWQPLEVTPGGVEVQETAVEDSSAPAESSEMSSEPAESSQVESVPLAESSSPAPAARPSKPAGFWGLWVLLALPAAAAAVILRRRWRASMRRREFYGGERNQAVLSMYGYLNQLRPYGGEVSGEIQALAQKAKFSRQGVTEEEAETVRRYTEAQAAAVSGGLSVRRGVTFRYIRALG